QFIRGHDIDLSALCVKGEIVAYTIQRGVVARTRNFAASAGVEFLEAPRLLSIVARMLRQLDYSGIAHIDARYDEDADDFKIIEINARYWGSLVASLKAGINFPDLACRWALGEELVASTYRNTRFMDALSFTKQIFGKPAAYSSRGFRVAETDLAFILSDPIAELVNVFNRRA
ncbi:MAG: ATP-grasp domain-containing protein, partial [Steroidobacteraceae bacterium]